MPNRSDYLATRPAKLPCIVRWLGALLIAASFISGGLIWLGQIEQSRAMETPHWLRPALVVHGTLVPLLSILFGYLLCQHISVGLRYRTNVLSGLVMQVCFAMLIVTGAGLYYASGEKFRDGLVLVHRVSGLAFPLALAWHWVAAIMLVRKGTRSLS